MGANASITFPKSLAIQVFWLIGRILSKINCKTQSHNGEFENVVIIGSDDAGVEHTFDFSSVLKHLVISPVKDENEHFDPTEVRNLLLRELR